MRFPSEAFPAWASRRFTRGEPLDDAMTRSEDANR